MQAPHLIFGVHLTDRATQVPQMQALLTQYGCNIKTRLGLHDVADNACSPRGLILLEMYGDLRSCRELKRKLLLLEGVDVQEMLFEHGQQ